MINKHKTITSLIAVVLLVYTPLSHAEDNAGAFIEKGHQARAAGMGMSYVSIARGSDAVIWNPAGLSDSTVAEVVIMGVQAYETRYLALQSAFPLWGMNWGVGYVNAIVDGIEETVRNEITEDHEKTGKTFSYKADAIYLGTGMRVHQYISVGVSTKVIHEKSYGRKGTGVGLDIGTLITTPVEGLSFGAAIQNIIAPNIKWDTPSKNTESLPLMVKAGVSMTFLEGSLLASVDVNKQKNRATKLNTGLEYKLMPMMSVRGGFENGELSLGTGINMGRLWLDFAWTMPSADIVDDVYRFSLGYRL